MEAPQLPRLCSSILRRGLVEGKGAISRAGKSRELSGPECGRPELRDRKSNLLQLFQKKRHFIIYFLIINT